MSAFAFFVLIIGMMVSAIAVSHIFIYYTLAGVFVLGKVGQELLIVSLVTLPALFIVSIIAAHYKGNTFTRFVYYISGIWLGLVTHLSLFWIFIWWGFGIAKLVGVTFPMPALIILAGIAAVAYTIYGAWNAWVPSITEITVRIPGLTRSWHGRIAVQISDVHLGLVFRERFLRKVMKCVSAVKPDIVFITGDIFDGTDGDLARYIGPLRDYHPPKGMYFITGNHEIYLGAARVKEILKDAPLKILDDEIVDIEGVQIMGVGYSQHSMRRELSEVLDLMGYDPHRPSILLYHEPEQVEEMVKKGINLQLSGHTHRGQIVPFMLLTMLFYGKYHYGKHVINNYTLYTSSGVGLWGPTVRTGSKSEIVVIRFE